MPALSRCLSIAGLGAGLCLALPGAGFAADTSGAMQASSSTCAPLGYVEKRIVAKAQIGVEAVRDYVYITRGVHHLGMTDVVANLDNWLASAQCSGMAVDDRAVRRNVALAAAMPSL
jgi:hypothetical protein